MNFAALFHHETNLHPVAAGKALYQEGDELDGTMFVLMHGTADVMVHGRVVETAHPGALLGEMAMIDDGVRSASVVARTDCELVVIDRRRFNFLVQQTPNFALGVMRVIAHRLRNVDHVL